MNIRNSITVEHLKFLFNTFQKFLREKYNIVSPSLLDDEFSEKAYLYTNEVGFNGVLSSKTSFRNQYDTYIGEIIKKGNKGATDRETLNKWLDSKYNPRYFLEFITIHFFRTPFRVWLKNNTISPENIDNAFRNLYFNKLFNSFYDTDKTEDSILKDIQEKNNLSKSDQEWILGVIPEIFLNESIRYDRNEYFGLYDNGTQYMSNPILFNGDISKYQLRNSGKILESNNIVDLSSNYKGTYLVHALSPVDDSIFLLCELGRFARISHSANVHYKTKKTTKIICVDEEWSQNNLTVEELKNGMNLDYERTEKLRMKIYKRILNNLGENVEEFKFSGFKEVKNEAQKAISNYRSIDREVEQYNKLANEEELFNHLKNYDEIIKDVESSTKFIENIKVSFASKSNSIKKSIIRYVLFQRYLQINLENYLKIGVFREFDFDHTFNQLNGSQKKITKDYQSYGLYFKDYTVKVPKKSNQKKEIIYEDRRIHPYFFPSGDYYNTLKNKYKIDFTKLKAESTGEFFPQKKEQYDKLIAELKSNVILISDFNNYNKILSIINRYRIKELAVIMCDFFSFIYYYFNKKDSLDLFRNSKFSKEFLNIWKASYSSKETRNERIYSEHFSNFLAFSYNTSTVPFYFYPYIFAFDELEDEEKFYKERYAMLIMNTLIKINNEIS